MFNKGFIKGHDNEFHYAQIQDLYDSIKNGNFNFYLNYETIHTYGMGVRLMYASLSHFITVFIKRQANLSIFQLYSLHITAS